MSVLVGKTSGCDISFEMIIYVPMGPREKGAPKWKCDVNDTYSDVTLV